MIERSTAMSRRVLEQLGDVKAWYDVIVEDDAERLELESSTSPLRAGYRVLVKDDGVIWAKRTSVYGDWIGPVAFKGDTGNKGWSPLYAIAKDAERVVLQLVGWTGGAGAAPDDDVGKYLGASGFVDDIEDAVDFRGLGFKFRGGYSGATVYANGDVVRHNGSSFVAVQPVPEGTSPSSASPPENTAFWHVLAEKGSDGTGTGDVKGPSSSVSDQIAIFDGETGKVLKGGGKTISELIMGDGSVTTAKLHDGAVTAAKISGVAADVEAILDRLSPLRKDKIVAGLYTGPEKINIVKNTLQSFETIYDGTFTNTTPVVFADLEDFATLSLDGSFTGSSPGSALGMHFSTDNGATYISSAGGYAYTATTISGSTVSAATGTDTTLYIANTSGLATERSRFQLFIDEFGTDGTRPLLTGLMEIFSSSPSFYIRHMAGYAGAAAYNAFRLFPVSGNMTVRLTLRGRRK